MPTPVATTSFNPRRSRMASCLTVALAMSSAAVFGGETHFERLPPILWLPYQPTGVHHVVTCDDNGGAGSLRGEITAANDGDTIDFDMSQMQCSRITLGSEILVQHDNLRIVGPGADQLTIDGNWSSRVFNHISSGELDIYDLSLANGYVSGAGAQGGCISSSGNLQLFRTKVSNCVAYDSGSNPMLKSRGGGIFAFNGLTLDTSTISGNIAASLQGQAVGGGVYASGNLLAKFSTISDNRAVDLTAPSLAGGVAAAFGNVTLYASTISSNRSDDFAGVDILGGNPNNSAAIYDSTVSSNVADDFVGGVNTSAPLAVVNSTIAFNTSYDGGALNADNRVIVPINLTLKGSIVAGNAGGGREYDLGMGTGSVLGSKNVIVAASVPTPPDTIHTCPHLGPLTDNGGPTLTQAPKYDSPALDQGSNTLNLPTDQRLVPRVVGSQADIGAVERQPSDVDDGLFASGFDGVCDR